MFFNNNNINSNSNANVFETISIQQQQQQSRLNVFSHSSTNTPTVNDFDMAIDTEASQPPQQQAVQPRQNILFPQTQKKLGRGSELFPHLKVNESDDDGDEEDDDEDEDLSSSSSSSEESESDDDDISDADIASSGSGDVDSDDDMGEAEANRNIDEDGDVCCNSNVSGMEAIQQQVCSNVRVYDIDDIRSMLRSQGLALPPAVAAKAAAAANSSSNCSKSKQILVRAFSLPGDKELIFTPYFFIVKSRNSEGRAVHAAQIMLRGSARDSDVGRSLLCASTPVGLTGGGGSEGSGSSKAMRRRGGRGRCGCGCGELQYSVGQQSFTVGGKGGVVHAQSLREQLKASEATMSRLMAQMQEERRPSPVARKVLHLLKEFFVEIKSYRYEVGRNSNKWNGVRGIAGSDLEAIAAECGRVMGAEPTLLRIDPPVYVIGDLHGNFKDFSYFAKAFGLWSSAEFTPAKFLFLGDYVDRGLHSIETLAFVLALKVLFPEKVFLLRGNHECAEVNGDEDTYQDGSFRRQCTMTYGRREGARLWERINACFGQMPLAAVIDNKIFCVHAGIPREIARRPDVPILDTVAAIQRPPNLACDLVFDLVWADPATPEEEQLTGGAVPGFPEGFGPNARGPATCVFGKKAVELFCRNSGCSHLIRAHQSPKLGVDVAKNATILTIFSSSHYCGAFNRAAAVLVHDHKLDVIVSNPAADTDSPNILTTGGYMN